MPIPEYTKWLIDPEITCQFCLHDNKKGYKVCCVCGEKKEVKKINDLVKFIVIE